MAPFVPDQMLPGQPKPQPAPSLPGLGMPGKSAPHYSMPPSWPKDAREVSAPSLHASVLAYGWLGSQRPITPCLRPGLWMPGKSAPHHSMPPSWPMDAWEVSAPSLHASVLALGCHGSQRPITPCLRPGLRMPGKSAPHHSMPPSWPRAAGARGLPHQIHPQVWS